MEWFNHCLWKLSLFLSCWKVRQKWKVMQKETQIHSWQLFGHQQPLFSGNHCLPGSSPHLNPSYLCGYGRATDPSQSFPRETDLGHRKVWSLPRLMDRRCETWGLQNWGTENGGLCRGTRMWRGGGHHQRCGPHMLSDCCVTLATCPKFLRLLPLKMGMI